MDHLIDSPFVFVVAILIVTVAVPVLSHHWYKVRKAEVDASLKHDMLQRGMSAEEIALVLEAPARRGSRKGYADRV
ncbi:MAG TPA: hypothetical protein VG013_37195 [Gemmataceae bacterium]|nr:hypothetical protein [Gemmataceae bacterium]